MRSTEVASGKSFCALAHHAHSRMRQIGIEEFGEGVARVDVAVDIQPEALIREAVEDDD